jgi:hypothetical protein
MSLLLHSVRLFKLFSNNIWESSLLQPLTTAFSFGIKAPLLRYNYSSRSCNEFCVAFVLRILSSLLHLFRTVANFLSTSLFSSLIFAIFKMLYFVCAFSFTNFSLSFPIIFIFIVPTVVKPQMSTNHPWNIIFKIVSSLWYEINILVFKTWTQRLSDIWQR